MGGVWRQLGLHTLTGICPEASRQGHCNCAERHLHLEEVSDVRTYVGSVLVYFSDLIEHHTLIQSLVENTYLFILHACKCKGVSMNYYYYYFVLHYEIKEKQKAICFSLTRHKYICQWQTKT